MQSHEEGKQILQNKKQKKVLYEKHRGKDRILKQSLHLALKRDIKTKPW